MEKREEGERGGAMQRWCRKESGKDRMQNKNRRKLRVNYSHEEEGEQRVKRERERGGEKGNRGMSESH